MPSALETLVKILKLEREQGTKNTAVIGGLAAFSDKWAQDAHTQARKPEHHLLVDELTILLRQYETIEAKPDRVMSIAYMLDRITGRVPPPPEFRAPAVPTPPPEVVEGARDTSPQAEAPPTDQTQNAPPAREERREQRQRREHHRQQEQPRAENARDEQNAAPPTPANEQNRPRNERPDRPKQNQQQNRPQNNQNNRRPQKPARDNDEEDGDEGGDMFRERGDDMSYDSYDVPVRTRGGRNQQGELDIAPMPKLARVPRRPRPKISSEEASDLLRGLKQPVTVLRGVGPGMAKMLQKLGIHTVNDMLYYLPRRYDDYTNLQTIAKLVPDPDKFVTIIGTVIHAEIRIGRGNRKDFFVVLDDGTARMGVTFFGRHFMIRQVKKGQQLVVSGVISIYGRQVQMTNPEWEPLETENLHTVGIVPVYPLTEGLSGRSLRKLMKSAIDYWSERIPDFVPEGTLERTELGDLGWALKNVHFPEGWDHLELARKRLIFDELLTLQLAMLGNRREWQSTPAQPLNVSDEYLNEFMQTVFPYPLTGAQRRAIEDVRRDVGQTRPMNRLLQGDVGSGKTAVATVVIAMALSQGKQAALMVPTSILAEQHYRGISATLAKMPSDRKPVVALLTGSLTTSERHSIYRGISDGSIDVVIGTHALIQEGVDFKDLAVAIIDEQHRFGVEQRKALRGKGTNPHLLVMTATPIPRTLALTIHADLDLSIIDEMPPGRIPIQTKVVQPVAREQVNNFIIAQINQGRQAFVVHPLVEASEKIEAPAAMEAYQRLQQVFFRNKVGLLHGRMKPAEKDEVMEAFASGAYDVLVTTSVAEVGVNVPNASVMVIEGANRFGLSQLHQFRGRVGRGEHASYCLLLADTNSEEAKMRLQAMEDTTDGFKLAEMDWRLRGAGDLIGTKQSGGSKMQLAEQMTPQLVEMAQRESRTIYEEDPNLSSEEHRLLAQRVVMLHNERTDVS
ncbi:MAG: ATP-dependent DNA helicase RecG [Anaerolineaceae bacterium]|nr:ATP-dependent DNA helicase RecG [Anaerolineaceae bacterium]